MLASPPLVLLRAKERIQTTWRERALLEHAGGAQHLVELARLEQRLHVRATAD